MASPSPTPSPATPSTPAASRLKAYDGAYAAFMAEERARNLMQRTRKRIDFGTVYDEKLPQVKTSHGAFLEEASRATAAETTVANPLFTSHADRERPTFRGCPSGAADDAFFAYAASELRSISLRPTARTVMASAEAQAAAAAAGKEPVAARTTTMSIEEAIRLKELLTDRHCRIDFVDFTAALDSLERPQPQPSAERLAESRLVVAARYGAEETEEGAEKVAAEVERLRGTYETYAEGLTFLAAKRLDRMAIITDALVANTSLTEVRLGFNNFGAPNDEDGRSFFGPLNRLERFIDHNKTVRVLDLSGNRAGPKGVGIIAKAMCKNIGVSTLNLSANDLMVEEAPEEDDDPEYEEDDAVFGELYEALEALSEMVKKNKFLRSLSLRHNFIKPIDVSEEDEEDMGTDTPLMKFFEPFQKYHRIEVLDLCGNELGDAGVRLLCHCLKQNQSVRHLDLSSNGVTAKGLGYIADWVAGSEHIDTLHLQKNLFAPKAGTKSKKAIAACLAAAQKFADAMAANKTLVEVNLSGNHFGPDMSAAILSRLSEAEQLTDLAFANNEMCSAAGGTDFTFAALAHIYAALEKKGSLLSALDLSGNFVQYKGIMALTRGPEAAGVALAGAASGVDPEPAPIAASPTLADFSGVLRGLVSLNLSRNNISDEGLGLLTKDLASGSVIVNLNLSDNALTSPLPLVRLIRSDKCHLTNLDVSRNRFGADGSDNGVTAFGSFCAAVTMSPDLLSLNIGANELTDAHAPAVGAICRAYGSSLRELLLPGNALMSTHAVCSLIADLRANASLSTVRLTAPSKGGDHAAILAAVVGTLLANRTLTDVDCALNMSVADEAAVAIAQRLLLLNGLRLAPPEELLQSAAAFAEGAPAEGAEGVHPTTSVTAL